MVCAPVELIIPSLKLGDYLSIQAHRTCSALTGKLLCLPVDCCPMFIAQQNLCQQLKSAMRDTMALLIPTMGSELAAELGSRSSLLTRLHKLLLTHDIFQNKIPK